MPIISSVIAASIPVGLPKGSISSLYYNRKYLTNEFVHTQFIDSKIILYMRGRVYRSKCTKKSGSKNVSSHSFWEHAQSSISFQVSILQRIAVTAIMIISRNLCFWLYGALGSGTSCIHPIRVCSISAVIMISFQEVIEIIVHDCAKIVSY